MKFLKLKDLAELDYDVKLCVNRHEDGTETITIVPLSWMEENNVTDFQDIHDEDHPNAEFLKEQFDEFDQLNTSEFYSQFCRSFD